MRPVATTLLMVAILLAGIIGYRFLPVSALPEVDCHSGSTLYPAAGCGDVIDYRTAGTPVWPPASSSQSSGGASVNSAVPTDLALDVAEQEVQAAINRTAGFTTRRFTQ